MLLGIDIGTTHCKAGLIDEAGRVVQLVSQPTPVIRDGRHAHCQPEQLWQTVAALLTTLEIAMPVAAIGIASMAESGLLIGRQDGQPRSDLLLWFDRAPAAQAQLLRDAAPAADRFLRFGTYPSFKCSLAKILWLREQGCEINAGLIWLNSADYIAYRLTDTFATDETLAGRTYAYDLNRRAYASDWLQRFELPTTLFADAQHSATPVGDGLKSDQFGLRQGTPVAVCGHDHLCAAFAAGALSEQVAFNSMGTAETLVGNIAARTLTVDDFRSGLTFGRHTARDQLYWLGGSSASGGSVDWLRGILGDPPLSYDDITALCATLNDAPSDLLFFPYLNGRGAPDPAPALRGAFVGLASQHGRADLLKAVFEGTAYQIEAIRQAAERHLGQAITRLIVTGGGSLNDRWLQIKANITGCQLHVAATSELTLLGAALLAGVGSGYFSAETEAQTLCASQPAAQRIDPHANQHADYQQRFAQQFLPLQQPLQITFGGSDETAHA